MQAFWNLYVSKLIPALLHKPDVAIFVCCDKLRKRGCGRNVNFAKLPVMGIVHAKLVCGVLRNPDVLELVQCKSKRQCIWIRYTKSVKRLQHRIEFDDVEPRMLWNPDILVRIYE